MQKALVTGAAGFIGSHVAKWLLEDGLQVVALDDLSGGSLSNVPTRAKWIEGSVADYGLLKALFEAEKFDYVFHLAAYAAEALSHFVRRFVYGQNLLGSVNLINLSVLHSIKCFVFTSSIAVYGSNQVPMTEDLVPQPEDPYGISKYAVELDLQAAQRQFGLKYIVFRPHNVYGELQNTADKYRNVIGIFMNQVLCDSPLTIFGDGEQTRAFTYIDDVAPIIARSIHNQTAYGEVFNLGGDTVCSVNELAQAVSNAMGVTHRVEYRAARLEVKHAYSSHAKARRYFDLAPATPLAEGLNRTAAWVKQVGAREPKGFTALEIPQGLPDGW